MIVSYVEIMRSDRKLIIVMLKLQLETNLGRSLQMKEPVMHWLIRWAAMSLSRFQVGKDRKTAYQRQTGRACNIEVMPFAEKVLYRKYPEAGPKMAMEAKWEEGLWLGHTRSSNEVIVGTADGITKCKAVIANTRTMSQC